MRLRKFILVAIIIMLAGLILVSGCDKRTFQPPEKVNPNYNITMESDKDVIYADNGNTYAVISVNVKKDSSSTFFPVAGKKVRFSTTIGSILQDAITDSFGIAKTNFWVNSSALVSDSIIAKVSSLVDDKMTTINIKVERTPEIPVNGLTLDVPAHAKVGTDVEVAVYVKNELDLPVADGTIVRFSSNEVGSFVNSQVETHNGRASTTFNTGTQANIGWIYASVGTTKDSTSMNILAGNGVGMTLEPETYNMGINATNNIIASVFDRYGNKVKDGTTVTFETNLGSIPPTATTIDGVGSVIFSPGATSGIATITAKADSAAATTSIQVGSSEVQSIAFEEGTIFLDVSGTGGTEAAQIRTFLYDSFGNLVNTSTKVYFSLLNAPVGTFLSGDTDEIGIFGTTANGIATITINSGDVAGTASLQALVMVDDDPHNNIVAVKNQIVIRTGPPATIAIAPAGFNEGSSIGGGSWKMDVAAYVYDINGNPVNTTVVFFSVDADVAADQQAIEIVPDAFTGNENSEGDAWTGVAFTTLRYHGSLTNHTVNIHVSTGSISNVFEHFVLPIQSPSLQIIATPLHIDFFEDQTENTKTSLLRVKLVDGQNTPIDGTTLVFYTDKGTFTEAGPDNDIYTEVTSTINGEIGSVNKIFSINKYECPPPSPEGLPGNTTAQVNVTILGHPDINTHVTLSITRYPTAGKGGK
jgi:hypothetical protein